MIESTYDKKQKSNPDQPRKFAWRNNQKIIRREKNYPMKHNYEEIPSTTQILIFLWIINNLIIAWTVKEVKSMIFCLLWLLQAVSGCASVTPGGFHLLGLASLKPIYFFHYLFLHLGKLVKHVCFLYAPLTICSFTFGKMLSTFESLSH